jgi:hypothetical protein
MLSFNFADVIIFSGAQIQILCKEVQQAFPDYTLQITPDLDLSE